MATTLTFQVPNPRMGISRPLFNLTFGILDAIFNNETVRFDTSTGNKQFRTNNFECGQVNETTAESVTPRIIFIHDVLSAKFSLD